MYLSHYCEICADQLEEEYDKKISEIESKHHDQFSQFETEFKEQVLKISTEEIKNLSNIFQKHFDDVSETINRLRNELDAKSTSVINTDILFTQNIVHEYLLAIFVRLKF